MRAVLVEHCVHRLQRSQREELQAFHATEEGPHAVDLLLGLDRARAVEAHKAAISFIAQLHAHSPQGQLVCSIELVKEVGPEQRG